MLVENIRQFDKRFWSSNGSSVILSRKVDPLEAIVVLLRDIDAANNKRVPYGFPHETLPSGLAPC